ncbi:MAG: ACT domain-containing protein [Anaerolineales bacterium]|nr:MAG: ACT domain-containing protein [Anaerolineales bacterium]
MNTPENDLAAQLAQLSPRLNVGEFVFITLKEHLPANVRPLAYFHEWEGESAVLRVAQAETIGLKYGATFAWITLDVHSALESVGLTAAVTGTLAKAGIPCNVIAAFHHDHLFVPFAERDRALQLLKEIQHQVSE